MHSFGLVFLETWQKEFDFSIDSLCLFVILLVIRSEGGSHSDSFVRFLVNFRFDMELPARTPLHPLPVGFLVLRAFRIVGEGEACTQC